VSETSAPAHSPIHLEEPAYQTCYAYWLRLKGQRWAPAWSEWKWSEIPLDLVPYFIVIDVTHDPLDFTYRFWGSANTRMHGIEMTGKSVRDIRSPVTARTTFDQYARVTANREAIASAYTMQSADYHLAHQRTALRMPMSNEGETVDRIVSFVDWRDSQNLITDEHIQIYGETSV